MGSEKLVDGHQTVPYQPGALFWGVNCLTLKVDNLLLRKNEMTNY